MISSLSFWGGKRATLFFSLHLNRLKTTMRKSTDNGPLAEKVRQTSFDLNGYHNTLSMSPSYYYFSPKKKNNKE